MTDAPIVSRDLHLRNALRLEYFTVGWNVIEGLVAVVAAVGVGSIALLGFGIDSFVESASAGILIWRLGAERRGATVHSIEWLDRREGAAAQLRSARSSSL